MVAAVAGRRFRNYNSFLRPLPTAVPGKRNFFSLPGQLGSETQNVSATRRLPYSQSALFDLIADVNSYSRFLPYCTASRVTKWAKPDEDGRRWPILADLHVGWGGLSETFTSQVRCVPEVSVEALCGDATSQATAGSSTVFKTLVARWHLKPLPETQYSASTEVNVTIKYQFANPLYAAVSGAISDKVAAMMIEAFEKRAIEQLGSR